jgi:hypothetical protein
LERAGDDLGYKLGIPQQLGSFDVDDNAGIAFQGGHERPFELGGQTCSGAGRSGAARPGWPS